MPEFVGPGALAGPDDPYAPVDPYAPPLLAPPPSPWELAAADLPPPPVLDAVQPGIGIPSGLIDAAVDQAPAPQAAYAQPLPPFDDGLSGAPVEPYASYPPPPPLLDGFGAAIAPDLAPPGLAPALAPAPPTPLAQPLPVDPYAPAPIDPYAALPAAIGPPLPPSPPPALDLTAADPFAGLTEAQGFAAARNLTPEALIQLEAIQNSRKAVEQATRQHRIEEEQLQQIRDNAEARRVADERTRADEEHINTAAAELGKQRLDRGRWFRNASTLQQVGAVVGTLVGGLMSKPGQPNQGVQFLANIIDDDINDQKYDIENQRADLTFRSGAVAREYQRTGDLHRATEAVRLATYNALIGQLQTDMQNFDSRGTAFREFGKQVAGLEARKAAQRQADGILRFDQHEKTERLRLEAQRVEDARIAHRQTTQLGYKQIESAAADRAAAAAARADEKATERADREAERTRQFAIGGLARVQVGPDNKPVIGADGKPVIVRDLLRNRDGSIWEAESPTATAELRKKKVAAEGSIAIIDEIRAIRGRVGGESKLLNSTDSQRLKVLMALSRNITKEGTDGMSSDEDGKVLTAAAGTGDADSWRDQDGALLEARAHTAANLNRVLAAAKYDGPEIVFPIPEPTKSTPEEDAQQALLAKPEGGFARDFATALEERKAGLSVEDWQAFGPPLDEGDIRAGAYDLGGRSKRSGLTKGPSTSLPLSPQQRQVFDEVARDFDPDASRTQRRQIADLGAAAVGTSEAAIDAAKNLQQVASEGKTTRLRELARDALQTARIAGTPGEVLAVPPDRAVVRETVPPPRPRGP